MPPSRARPRWDEQVLTQHVAGAPPVIPDGRLATSAGSSSGGPLESQAHPAHNVSEITPQTQAGDGVDVSYEDLTVRVAGVGEA